MSGKLFKVRAPLQVKANKYGNEKKKDKKNINVQLKDKLIS